MRIIVKLETAAALAAALILCASALPARTAGTVYEGFRVHDDNGAYKADKAQTVRFVLDGENVTGVVLHLADATKDLTFKTVRDVPKDGSSFAGWFVKEFRDLTSADGTPVTYEAFLAGAYAGLSPAVTEGYGMAAQLKTIAEGLGLPVPARTFVIYGAERKPIYEFFCYPVDPMPARGQAPDLKTIKLDPPGKTRGLPVMEALSLRASVREWSDKDLTPQDLSDLLWAANGVNRPDGRRTAPSAMNAQDVDIYVFLKAGAYRYDAAAHALVPVVAGDHRQDVAPPRMPGAKPAAKPETPAPGAKPGPPPAPAPVLLVLVTDTGKFRMGEPEAKLRMGALDVGIVSQNIGIFCAGTGLATRPRASMDAAKVKELLKLGETQYPLMNHPVGYPK
jgi:nitroreductase